MRAVRLGILATLVLGMPAWACPVGPAALTGLAEQAESGLVALEEQPVLAAQDALSKALSCLDAPAEPTQVAAVYRVHAAAAFAAGDLDATTAAFGRVRHLDPDWTPTTFPETHPFRRMFTTSTAVQPTTRAVPAPASGQLIVDGVAYGPGSDPRVPVGVSTLVQWIAPGGAGSTSSWLVDAPTEGGVGVDYPVAGPADVALPTPAERSVSFSVGVGALALPRSDVQTTLYATLEPSLRVRLAGGLGVRGRALVGVTAVPEGAVATDGSSPDVGLLPAFRLGLDWRVPSGVRPWVGASGAVALHEYVDHGVGGTLDAGIRPRLGDRTRAELAGSVGFAGGAWISVSAGLGF